MDLYRAPDANTRSCFSLEEISNLSKKKRPFSGHSSSRRFDAFNFHKIKCFLTCLKYHPLTSLGRQIANPSLHCRAFKLCFNTSLNRLPTNANPLFQNQPSFSNALVAALKRTQARQRRGCVGAAAEPTKPAVLGGYLSRLFPSSAELFRSRPMLSIPFKSLITVLDALSILNQTH